ncbi:MAG: hypothetical protein IJN65_05800 [Clostridia bacterium]|nr:hypothetical protein [Clostridia bacterium]
MANNIAYASRYSTEIDKIISQKSKTGMFADNSFKSKFVGANTVIMPDIEFVGLGDYSRENGYPVGDTAVKQTSYTLTKDRGRQLPIDAQDADESGVADLVGKVAGEFTRTQVIPEMDAYNISSLYKVAKKNNNVTTFAEATAVKDLIAAINAVDEKSGYSDEQLIAFVDPTLYSLLMNSPELTRMIVASDFKQGEANFKVNTLNGCAIIPVSANRMMSDYTFKAGTKATEGGFAPATDAKNIRAVVLPQSSATLVKKVENLRVFTPDENILSDSYVVDFRLYYDLFVKKNKEQTIFAIA